MDIEFHYYITFILCRKAGYSEDDAYTRVQVNRLSGAMP
jgi:hypothetical protein